MSGHDPIARPLHRGTVHAAALLIDETLLGEAAARRRVLAAWVPGARVRRCGSAWLVVWPESRRVHSDAALGLPLVAGANGSLLGAPLAGEAPAGAVVCVRAGRVVVEQPGPAEDPAAWLDVAALPVAEVSPLAAEPAPPPAVEATPPARDARVLLGASIGEAPPESAGLREALEALRAGKGTLADVDPATGVPRLTRSPALALGATLVLLAAGLLAVVTWPVPALSLVGLVLMWRAAFNDVRTSAARAAPARAPAAPAGPSWRTRLTAWLGRTLARSPLAPWLGRQHARYVARMMQLFERGDLGEALRWAIPIGGESEPGGSLAAPRPRDSIGIRPWARGSAGATIDVGDYLGGIRHIYRRAFERLEREGRIDEAAYVLAELLRVHAEAITFLERHGRLRLAAELAEARGQPPGEVVRLWLLAGEPARALELARRHGAYADAIARLEKSHPAAARGLRLAWADAVASRGDFLAAVEVLARDAASVGLVRAWLAAARQLGGTSAARALVRQLELYPADFPALRTHVLHLCADAEPAAAGARAALVTALLEQPGRARPERAALARPLARAALRDGLTQREASLLADLAGPELVADLPGADAFARPPTPLAQNGVVRVHEIEAGDAGHLPVYSAVFLPSGRVLAALGDAGVLLLDPTGAVLHHFDQPCDTLVAATPGHAALALAARGDDVWRVARLDLLRMSAASWCTLQAHAFASAYDGERWFVADATTVRALDVLAPAPRATWELDKIGRIAGLSVAPAALGIVSDEGGWGYELAPGREPVLRTRTLAESPRPPAAGEDRRPCVGVSPDGAILDLVYFVAPDAGASHVELAERRERMERRLTLTTPVAAIDQLCSSDKWTVSVVSRDGQVEIGVATRQPLCRRATLRLPGAASSGVRVRLQPDAVVVWDGLGRVHVLSLTTGELVRRLRIRWP